MFSLIFGTLKLYDKTLFWVITRPNCALYSRAVLCLYVPGFQRQVLEHVPKSKWIPLTKFQWVPRTNTSSVNFVGTLILLRIPQRANLGTCCSFRKCNWNTENYAYSAYNLQIPLTLCWFRSEFADSIYSCGFRHSLSLLNTHKIICSWIHQVFSVFHTHTLLKISQSYLLFWEQFLAIQCLSYLSMESKTTVKIKEKKQFCGLRDKFEVCLLRNPPKIHKIHRLAS